MALNQLLWEKFTFEKKFKHTTIVLSTSNNFNKHFIIIYWYSDMLKHKRSN